MLPGGLGPDRQGRDVHNGSSGRQMGEDVRGHGSRAVSEWEHHEARLHVARSCLCHFVAFEQAAHGGGRCANARVAVSCAREVGERQYRLVFYVKRRRDELARAARLKVDRNSSARAPLWNKRRALSRSAAARRRRHGRLAWLVG